MAATTEDLQGRIKHFRRLTEAKRISQLRSIEEQFIHGTGWRWHSSTGR